MSTPSTLAPNLDEERAVAQALIAKRARVIATLVTHEARDLPAASFTLNGTYLSSAVSAHLGEGEQVDEWAQRFDATAVTKAYVMEEHAGLGRRSFVLRYLGVKFDVWAQVSVDHVDEDGAA